MLFDNLVINTEVGEGFPSPGPHSDRRLHPPGPGVLSAQSIAQRLIVSEISLIIYGKPPQQPIDKETARQLTQGIVDKDLPNLAIMDVMATGEASFAKAYLQADKIRQHKPPVAPLLEGPVEFARNLDAAPNFTWAKSKSTEGAALKYTL